VVNVAVLASVLRATTKKVHPRRKYYLRLCARRRT